MYRNALIIFLCILCNILFVLCVLIYYVEQMEARAREKGHPLPIASHLFVKRDPDNNRVRFLIDAVEWNHGSWSLSIYYKAQDNRIVRFSTACPNDPMQWLSVKLASPDSAHGDTLLFIEEVEGRWKKVIPRELIWNYLMKQ